MSQNQTLKDKLKNRKLAAQQNFYKSHPDAHKYFKSSGIDLGKIREHSAKLLASGAIASSLMLSSPKTADAKMPALPAAIVRTLTSTGLAMPENSQEFIKDQIHQILPTLTVPNVEQESEIANLYEKLTGIHIASVLEGEKLNTCFGLIGAEQHLPRYPGDAVSQHNEFQESGITPGLGAWGYFVPNQNRLTEEDILKEKYYVAVQTLYLPDWNTRFKYLRDWYKHRKVLVINPNTGQGVVAVIADAGPAAWTGKQFGGSPEVMYALNLHKGMRKGAVFLFFVDDPENKVSLGPVNYNTINLPKIPIAEKENAKNV